MCVRPVWGGWCLWTPPASVRQIDGQIDRQTDRQSDRKRKSHGTHLWRNK